MKSFIEYISEENKRNKEEQKAFSLGFQHGFFDLTPHEDHRKNPHYMSGHAMGMDDAVFDRSRSGTRWSSMGPDEEIINKIW
jgi:hypothetical protein